MVDHNKTPANQLVHYGFQLFWLFPGTVSVRDNNLEAAL